MGNMIHAGSNEQHEEKATCHDTMNGDAKWCAQCNGHFFLCTEPVIAEIAIRARVKVLADELPGVTFGYVGNFERWGDDRSFCIFLPHPGRVGTYGDSVSLGQLWQLPGALDKWDGLADAARRQYNDGSIRCA